MNIRLLINNHEADLGEGANPILLNKYYENLTNPTDYHADWSKTVRLPFSRQNNYIFDNFFRADSLITGEMIVDPLKKVPFILLYNNSVIMRGYCKVALSTFAKNERGYDLTLFGMFGDVIGELKKLTFDPTADVDAKYIIESPFRTTIDRYVVHESFNREGHSLDVESNNVLDYIGFLASYQGRYPDFDSGVVEPLRGGEPKPLQVYYGPRRTFISSEQFVNTNDLDHDLKSDNIEVDEHWMREFRSYYQQPFIWVDKLWQLTKKKLEEITDYKLELSERWFNQSNPYYYNLIYTCPTLFDTSYDSRDNKINQDLGGTNTYTLNPPIYKCHVKQLGDLTNTHRGIIKYPYGMRQTVCNPNTGLFNGGEVKITAGRIKLKGNILLFAGCNDASIDFQYARIRQDNCIYLNFKAVRQSDMSQIGYSSKIVKIVSGDNDCSNNGVVQTIDVGKSRRGQIDVQNLPDNHGAAEGFWWKATYDIELEVLTAEPFYITVDCYTANNSTPFEYAMFSTTPQWDWLWEDRWFTYDPCASCGDRNIGMTLYIPSTTENKLEGFTHIRSNSELTMARVYPKKKPVFDILLDYCKMFGLYFKVDEDEKTVRVMDRNEYFQNYEILNWTKKLDRSNEYNIKPVSFEKRWVSFNYDEGKGQRYEEYQNKYELNYGSKRVDTGYQFNDDTIDIYKDLKPSMITSKKQGSAWLAVGDYTKKELTDNVFVENDNEGSNAGNSGSFFFHNGTQPCDSKFVTDAHDEWLGDVMITDDSWRMITSNEYYWSLNAPALVSEHFPLVSTFSKDNKYSIHFERPKEEYFNRMTVGDTSETKYIYNHFWKRYIEERYNVENKVLTTYFYLTPEDYRTFSFDKFVMIDNNLYHVNRIFDFNPENYGPTKVELVQVWDIKGYTKSFESIPYLSIDTPLNVNETEPLTVPVRSSSPWRFYFGMGYAWLTFRRSGNPGDTLDIVADGGYDGVGSRQATLTFVNNEGVLYTIIVRQYPFSPYIRLSKNNIVYEYTGGSTEIEYEAFPSNVSLVSKPSWLDVEFDSYVYNPLEQRLNDVEPGYGNSERIVSSFPNRYEITRNARNSINVGSGGDIIGPTITNVIKISTNSTNNTSMNRRGYVVITNGEVSKSISVMQKAGMVIVIGDDPVAPIELNGDEPLEILSMKELDRIYMTNGTLTNENGSNAGVIQTRVAPDATSTGGIIRVVSLDGETRVVHYNSGSKVSRKSIYIASDEGCEVSVLLNNTLYGTYFKGDAFYMDVEVGTTIMAVAGALEGYAFDGWSDGNQYNRRTFTVDTDMHFSSTSTRV